MADKDCIDYIDASDGGDGSTYISIKFKDGERVHVNPDIPYWGETRMFLDDREDIVRQEGEPKLPD